MADHHRIIALFGKVKVGDYVESISDFFVFFFQHLFHSFLRGYSVMDIKGGDVYVLSADLQAVFKCL